MRKPSDLKEILQAYAEDQRGLNDIPPSYSLLLLSVMTHGNPQVQRLNVNATGHGIEGVLELMSDRNYLYKIEITPIRRKE